MNQLVFLFIGIFVGFAIGFLLSKIKKPSEETVAKQDFENLLNTKNSLEIERGKLEERASLLAEEVKATIANLSDERSKVLQLNTELTAAQSAIKNTNEKLQEQKAEVEQLQEKFKTEFKNIANELLEDKSRKFTQQNQEKLGEILNPLNEKIKLFEQKVEQTHRESLEKNAGLVQQIHQLKELNLQMSKEAVNLTNALKGDNKTQGNWGEVILERVLERSGLQRDREYVIQESLNTDDGKRFQPDVVIHLPESRNIIIDSKVSLVDYERFVSAENEEEKALFLKKHILSLRNHIKGLSEKNYPQLYGTSSPDFVLMFIPIEPAFSLAVQYDNDLFLDSFDKKIVLVSASTLLAVLRTVASIWRQENITKNHLEIAKQAGDLYDKFVAFVEDLIKVGNQLATTKSTYDDAMKKLHAGSGNLVKRAEKIKTLGAKASKSLPQALLDRANED
ncbi:MAG: DNA recombination protein RmuC [Chitinophagales bacterium]|nr:DNA recombination protein RmuC [Chitinophagales bacterium]MCO5280831.1 DNA recombination protein RmuC [Chitinophagales bacterium]OJV25105.1 MAG: DNA polymerase V [Bacteroidetes bacterium 37-13]HRN93238.1 DNA recombination protein RmuC [Chitinophagales bacterium]HRP39561.1 DNA recombination protein RmuC [Chitinophagales bacterium]